jgi:hypothetical protein
LSLRLPGVVQGKKQGWGTQHYPNGQVYTGHFHDGKRRGFGRLEFENGDVYEGAWDDVQCGHGRLYFADGDIFEGEWVRGIREGLGALLRLRQVWWQLLTAVCLAVCRAGRPLRLAGGSARTADAAAPRYS